jgi:hypothetical protein
MATAGGKDRPAAGTLGIVQPLGAMLQPAFDPFAQMAAAQAGKPFDGGEAAVLHQQQQGPRPPGQSCGKGCAASPVFQQLALFRG